MELSIIVKIFPSANYECTARLYIIEVTLRELIVEELSRLHGPRWYKSALPGGNIMATYKAARLYQQETPWVRCVPLHPVYYLDFPDLATIIERKNNWDKSFKSVFFKRKDTLISGLRTIEPIRNQVAHNRKVAQGSLEIITGVLDILTNTLGEGRIVELVNRCTNSGTIGQHLKELCEEVLVTKNSVINGRFLPHINIWQSIKQAWWFDDEYLESDLTPIKYYFDILLSSYEMLPKGRGTGHITEQWINKNQFTEAVKAVTNVLEPFYKNGETQL